MRDNRRCLYGHKCFCLLRGVPNRGFVVGQIVGAARILAANC